MTAIETVIVLLIGVPILAALPFGWGGDRLGSAAGWIAGLIVLAGLAALVPLLGTAPLEMRWPWVAALDLDLAFRIDGLSLLFSMTIAGIAGFVLIYAGAYLGPDARRGRFLATLLVFTGAMQGLVLADNLIVLCLFWELTSVASFLLIGFDAGREAARRSAVQALVVTGLGGLALLAAAIGLRVVTGSWEISGMAGGLGASPAYPLLLTLVLLAAFTKSAQVPLHFWLPNAMEAPTPVSALLHSATMVQGGVYLLMRLSPVLGGTAAWQGLLMGFGALTLAYGAMQALVQTDMKQMLAQTTLASLGLLVLLIGVGSEAAVTAALLYFLAHALYKAGLFLVVGAIDHEAGSRDITTLGGLGRRMRLSFAAALLGAAAMFGLMPLLGFFAKEEVYEGLTTGDAALVLVLGVAIIGNALMGAVGLAIAFRPFLGAARGGAERAHEAPAALWLGPLLFGIKGFAAGLMLVPLGDWLLGPALAAVTGHEAELHLHFGIDLLALPFWLSVLTWALALVLFRFEARWRGALGGGLATMARMFDRAFDRLYFGLVQGAATLTRAIHHGRLERSLIVTFGLVGLAALLPLAWTGSWPTRFEWPELRFYEWGVVGLAVLGLGMVVVARSRLLAILALGVQGTALSLLFMLFGAPDLSFTQFMVEVLSVVILGLVMARLKLDAADPRPLEDWLRDGLVAVIAAIGIGVVLLRVLEGVLDPRLSTFFNANSVAKAHGHNIVNVILVDFRGLDTLGEISVVMGAGIAVLALIRVARAARTEVQEGSKGG